MIKNRENCKYLKKNKEQNKDYCAFDPKYDHSLSFEHNECKECEFYYPKKVINDD